MPVLKLPAIHSLPAPKGHWSDRQLPPLLFTEPGCSSPGTSIDDVSSSHSSELTHAAAVVTTATAVATTTTAPPTISSSASSLQCFPHIFPSPPRPVPRRAPPIPPGRAFHPNPHDQDPTPGFPYAFPDPLHGVPLLLDSVVPARDAGGPYSRSPELRVSHKIAERKRRKAMKDSFELLKANLPGEHGAKASKADALHMANDYITRLREENLRLSQQLAQTQSEVQALRQRRA